MRPIAEAIQEQKLYMKTAIAAAKDMHKDMTEQLTERLENMFEQYTSSKNAWLFYVIIGCIALFALAIIALLLMNLAHTISSGMNGILPK